MPVFCSMFINVCLLIQKRIDLKTQNHIKHNEKKTPKKEAKDSTML